MFPMHFSNPDLKDHTHLLFSPEPQLLCGGDAVYWALPWDSLSLSLRSQGNALSSGVWLALECCVTKAPPHRRVSPPSPVPRTPPLCWTLPDWLLSLTTGESIGHLTWYLLLWISWNSGSRWPTVSKSWQFFLPLWKYFKNIKLSKMLLQKNNLTAPSCCKVSCKFIPLQLFYFSLNICLASCVSRVANLKIFTQRCLTL